MKRATKRYTTEELAQVEASIGATLPAALRSFLLSSGAGTYGTVDIYFPEAVAEQYGAFFDDPSELFSLYVPFGERTIEQEMLIYRSTDGTYASIWHETVPEDWPDEEWQPFTEEALGAIVASA